MINLFKNLSLNNVKRKHGNIELLIGMMHASIHPIPIEESGGLILYPSKFGRNRILGGTHDLVKEKWLPHLLHIHKLETQE